MSSGFPSSFNNLKGFFLIENDEQLGLADLEWDRPFHEADFLAGYRLEVDSSLDNTLSQLDLRVH